MPISALLAAPQPEARPPSLVPGRTPFPTVGHARLLFPVGPDIEMLAAAFAALGPTVDVN